MASIKWDDNYKIGIKTIDEEHEHFVNLIDTVYQNLESNDNEKIQAVIKDLSDYADHHFKTEEKYFDELDYADATAHKAAHHEMMKKINDLADPKMNQKSRGFELLRFLEKWLLVHFRGMDKKYVETLKAHGIK